MVIIYDHSKYDYIIYDYSFELSFKILYMCHHLYAHMFLYSNQFLCSENQLMVKRCFL